MELIDFLLHCVGGCSRAEWLNLRGIRPSQVTCSYCGSNAVAIWHQRHCVYAHSGKVEYPMFDTPFGTAVKGGAK